MAKQLFNTIQEEIAALKVERKAILLAHNYQTGDIQDLADFTGDSLGLAQQAAQTDAQVIVFCGVHFMAETASILCPDKKVLLPDLEAGCSLADMITADDVRAWKKQYPGGLVVSYVNTSADVKAESDYCCTSSNAVKVVASLPANVPILFIPDFFLGNYVKEKTGRNIHLWRGYCQAHTIITSESVNQLKHDHPKAEFLMHPECGCSTKSMHLADQVMSTEGMVRYAQESKAGEFIVATETGILHKMRKQSPEKKFFAANEQAVCGFMKKVTLEKIVWALENLKYEVKVPKEIAQKALKPIERMLEIV